MNKTDQYRILTSMPIDSSVQTIQKTFGVTEHTDIKSQVLQKEKGLLSTPHPKPGKQINEEVLLKSKQFNEDDLISRQMAGKKDYVSMRVDGEKMCVYKRSEYSQLFEKHIPSLKKNFQM